MRLTMDGTERKESVEEKTSSTENVKRDSTEQFSWTTTGSTVSATDDTEMKSTPTTTTDTLVRSYCKLQWNVKKFCNLFVICFLFFSSIAIECIMDVHGGC